MIEIEGSKEWCQNAMKACDTKFKGVCPACGSEVTNLPTVNILSNWVCEKCKCITRVNHEGTIRYMDWYGVCPMGTTPPEDNKMHGISIHDGKLFLATWGLVC